MKIRTVISASELDAIVTAAAASAVEALSQLRQVGSEQEALKVLWDMKVGSIGRDPLNSDAPLNLIEQINQTFTYIASARAASKLFELHPNAAPFTLNLGTSTGSDIESKKDGNIAAEVFAAVSTSNNKKLAKDIAKVKGVAAQFRYVFFMCPGIGPGRQEHLEKQAGVQVWSVGDEI